MQVRLQFVRIVRKRFQILPLDHDRAGVAGGVHIQSGGRLIGDDHLLFLGLDGQFYVQLLGLACGNFDAVLLKLRKSSGDHFHAILARRKSLDFINSLRDWCSR